jgi:glutaminyl-tRNA synthetase
MAYVCDLTAEQTREYRGSLTRPGKDSPYRQRSVHENLDLFRRMKDGEFPMYDWAHGQSDSIERITHSICTLEFENHRPLYDWYLDQLQIYHPQQIEFARLNVSYTVLSKRKLIELVQKGYVSGWKRRYRHVLARGKPPRGPQQASPARDGGAPAIAAGH